MSVEWMIPDDRPKLAFKWAGGAEFTFDLGGTMHGDDFQGQTFYGEVKDYRNAQDQPKLYDEYLAKCYRSLLEMPNYCDHFLWITWAPFRATTWADQCEWTTIRAAVEKHAVRTLEKGVTVPDDNHCREVAKRLWIVVLSKRQEVLTVTPHERALIIAERARRA